MQILFLHGWHSVPGGVKPTYLKGHGHQVLSPTLHNDDFAETARTAQAEFDGHRPEVVDIRDRQRRNHESEADPPSHSRRLRIADR